MARLRMGSENPKAWLAVIYGDEYHGKWAGTKIDDEGNVLRLKVPQADPEHDCYINLADISPTYPRSRKKTRKTDIVGTRWVWADFDPPKDIADLDAWREATFDLLISCDTVRIHYVIDSGRGFWALANLDAQVSADDGDLLTRAYGKALAKQLDLPYDKQSVDVTRIVRLPGTVNRKTGVCAQFHEVLAPASENQLDSKTWLEALKEQQEKILEEYQAAKKSSSDSISLSLREAINKFNSDNAFDLSVSMELSTQVEHLQGKPHGDYLTWAVEGRSSKSKGGLTCKLATGRFHIHSETLSSRFGIADPDPRASYDLLDLCVMAKWRTGGPANSDHRKKRILFLTEAGYYQYVKSSKTSKTEKANKASDDDDLELQPLKKKEVQDKDSLLLIAAGLHVPDRLLESHVSIWEENDWFAQVLLMAQKNRVAPAAMLMSTLVRCGAAAGGAIEGGVKRIGFDEAVSLTLYVILSGAVGTGKTMANKIAKRFCPLDIDSMRDGVNIMSAAGLAEAFIERDIETERQVNFHKAAIFHFDEGDITSSRTAAEHGLASGLREIWSTGALKQVRASAKYTRYVEDVGIGLTMGIQPGNRCAIVDDSWGLNERTLYAIVSDPKRPTREERLAIPDVPNMVAVQPRRLILSKKVDDCLEELQDALMDSTTLPDWAGDLSRKHGDLNLMKLSALMACIRDPEGFDSDEVNVEDFRLGLLLMEMSNAARSLHEYEQAQSRSEINEKTVIRRAHEQILKEDIVSERQESALQDAMERTEFNIIKKSDSKEFTFSQACNWCSKSTAWLSQRGIKRADFVREIIDKMVLEGSVTSTGERNKKYLVIHKD